MDSKSYKSIHSGFSKSNSASSSRAMKLETAARMAELTYLAEVLKEKQALEREEALLIEKRNRELDEIKWIKKAGNNESGNRIRGCKGTDGCYE